MTIAQRALRFKCHADWLFGIATLPAPAGRRGVIIVVGGPQYRVGSHRQFTLLARSLGERGIPVMRFDYRGMGDSEGTPRQFDDIDDDLRAAVDHFTGPAFDVREVVLWGLCDGASAAMLYAGQDARVSGLVLANPWVRSAEGLASATLKHYYRRRLLEPAFWRKLVSGRFDALLAGRSLLRLVTTVLAARVGAAQPDAVVLTVCPSLHERLLSGLAGYRGQVLLVTSGADLTAHEFLEMERRSAPWKAVLGRGQVTRRTLADADHTFSRRIWRDQVASYTADWIESW